VEKRQHRRIAPLLRQLDRLRGTSVAARLQRLPLTTRVYQATRGSIVTDPVRFAASELARRPGVFVYELRSGGRVAMRHAYPDVTVLDEIFWWDFYEPPSEAAARLPEPGAEISIADFGANVGMFGVWCLQRWPGARITGVEPDPENARICRLAADANGAAASWDILEACVGPREGTVTFLAGQGAQSRVVDGGARGTATIEVEQLDAFEVAAGADLVKIDIEGSEWPLLADPRMSELAADVVLLEYHGWGDGLTGSSHDLARSRLAEAGFDGYAVERMPDECGIGWAWRTTSR
jgi:FkbM family methyltransferase